MNKILSKTVLGEGIFILLLGILVLIIPQFTGIALALVLSISLMLAGLYKLVTTLTKRDSFRNPLLSTLVSIIMIVTGIYLSLHPFFNLMILTIAAGLYFLLEGFGSIAIALKAKETVKTWWVVMLSAIIQFALAFIIIMGLPTTAVWTIAILFGVNLIFAGIGIISISMSLNEITAE